MPISNTLQAIHVIETHGISALSIHATGEGVEIEVADLDPLITPTTAVRPHHGGRAIAVDGVDIIDSAARFGAARAAVHDRIEGALSAALGDPPLGEYPGDPNGCPDLEHLLKRVQSIRHEADEAYQHLARALGYPHGPGADGEPDPSAPYVADPHTLGTLAGEAADRIELLRQDRETLAARVEQRDHTIAELRSDLADLRRLLHQLVVIACGAQDIGQTPEARRDIVAKAAARISEDRAAIRAAIEEMRLTLAAEQGRQEGAPDPAWIRRKMMNGESYWEKWYPAGDVAIVRLDGSFSRGHFGGKTTARHGKADNQRAAMLAADAATR